MLSGFNTNYRHRGVLFHVQTEDSGRSNPHVITHLFYGGNIIASEKQKYSDQLGSENLDEVVRALMEGQHKAMLKRLSRGEHDAAIAQRLGAKIFQDSGDTADTLPPEASDAPPSVAPPPAAPPPDTPKERIARAFGDSVVSQKPLDEVVLDYLVENARKRKRQSK